MNSAGAAPVPPTPERLHARALRYLERYATTRAHLRRVLRVRAPDGSSMLFRFYDPRAFRTVIPVLDAPARKEFFGPIHGAYVESRSPDSVLFFARDGRAEPQALPLSTAA